MTARWTPRPYRLYRRTDLRAKGVHSRRLASSDMFAALPGHVTLAAQPAPLLEVARALTKEVLPGAVPCGLTAAELLAAPLPPRFSYAETGHLHVALPRGDHRRAGPHVTVHHRVADATKSALGISVSSPADVLCEVSSTLSLLELITVADHLVGNLEFAPSLTQLRKDVAQRHARHGSRTAQIALEEARERVESPMETWTRCLILAAGLPEPVPNRTVRVPWDKKTFRIDLSYPQWKIAIEYDGRWHFTEAGRRRRDTQRESTLRRLGWEVLRLTADDVGEPAEFLENLRHAIATAVAAAASREGSPRPR